MHERTYVELSIIMNNTFFTPILYHASSNIKLPDGHDVSTPLFIGTAVLLAASSLTKGSKLTWRLYKTCSTFAADKPTDNTENDSIDAEIIGGLFGVAGAFFATIGFTILSQRSKALIMFQLTIVNVLSLGVTACTQKQKPPSETNATLTA